MEKYRRNIRSFNVFEGHAFYTPAVGGMFASLGLLIFGALFGARVTARFTLSLGTEFTTVY